MLGLLITIAWDEGVSFPVILAGGPDWRQRSIFLSENPFFEYIS